MLEIDPKFRMERKLTNRIDQVTELFKYDWLILSPSENRFLTSWTLDLILIFYQYLINLIAYIPIHELYTCAHMCIFLSVF